MTIEGGIDKRGREAADWFALLNQRRVATADLKAFSAWRRDPENARAFGKLEAVWDTAGGLANTPEIARMKAEARTSACKGARGEGRRIVLVGVGAGTVAALVLGATTLWWSQQPTRYTTAIGEQRTIALEDGSRLTLDTASEAAVRLGSAEVISHRPNSVRASSSKSEVAVVGPNAVRRLQNHNGHVPTPIKPSPCSGKRSPTTAFLEHLIVMVGYGRSPEL